MRFLILLLILIPTHNLLSQKIGLASIGVSANAYQGDLNSNFEKWSSIYHFGFKFNANKKLNGNFNLGFGYITGENINYQFDSGEFPAPSPNRFFRTPLFMLNYEMNYNFLKWKGLTLYIIQGIGLLRFNPQDEFFEDYQNQPETRASNETFSNVTLILPTQLGILYLFKNHFGLSVQLGLINSLTDYLDNISDWGQKDGIDKILSTRFSFHVPINLHSNSQSDLTN